MARGPLPKPGARRRNAPTIPGSVLPAEGRKGRAPKCPYVLGVAGKAWWRWAWATPQASKWDDGSLYALGRRAQLEDDLAALDGADGFDLGEFLDLSDDGMDVLRRLEAVVFRLKSMASGRVGVMREMRELDGRFGLTPKAMADLRWSVESAYPPSTSSGEDESPAGGTRHLRAV
jgi:hypothetical protein